MEHTYLVCYDISEPRRWRKVYKTMRGFGDWLQLSVFQCRLSREKVLRMTDKLSDIVDHGKDNILVIDLGPTENVRLRVECIGRPFVPIEKKPLIV
jgi:CRISPR-associated protein Cas2